MKRKRPDSPVAATHSKRQSNQSPQSNPNNTCRFIRSITQYGILKSIASHLFPKDLHALAASSRAAYRAVFPRKESRKSLLSQMSCDGTGIRIRNCYHRKSKFFAKYNCQEFAVCATQDKDRIVECSPCASCGLNTCNECRVHCVYQSIYQPAEEDDELADYSGFTLLNGSEMRILSPEHLGIDGTESWKWKLGVPTQSHHDQGILDIPLECDRYAEAEPVEGILDADLGSNQLKGTGSSDSPHPSPIIQAFWNITEERKRMFCKQCFDSTWRTASTEQCHCTLRKRFLDRWLCLKCYERENKLINEYPHGAKVGMHPSSCPCGKPPFANATVHTVCLWCKGEIST
ncbi:hypothetical protein EJ04DRAFT_564909 [Polyplosphaeria fusca]|uniref:Uncharacterized protein n=1 Tax=Polyplosphaeria fusca TaxID=682080 RepID=A0A9P4QVW0_9PLEO|nr:hypothetical protein EJ04DRAFT_564909 [Polyplosphaeria fusca]